jgi:hypothetical protein
MAALGNDFGSVLGLLSRGEVHWRSTVARISPAVFLALFTARRIAYICRVTPPYASNGELWKSRSESLVVELEGLEVR